MAMLLQFVSISLISIINQAQLWFFRILQIRIILKHTPINLRIATTLTMHKIAITLVIIWVILALTMFRLVITTNLPVLTIINPTLVLC